MAASLSLVACKQGEGELCEVDSDCGAMLVCCPPRALPDGRGVCQPASEVCGVRVDGGPRPDSGVQRDAGPDAAADGGPLDGGPVDGGPVDGGPTDGGPTDGGPPDTGVVDAGDTGEP